MVTIHDKELEDWDKKFMAKEIHLVCVASGGFTICDCAASTVGGMKQMEEVWPLTDRVNQTGETGTFYPRLPLTVVPLLKGKGRPESMDTHDFLRRSFEDVAKVNREHIKSKTFYIDLNGWSSYYPFDAARRMAEEVLCRDSDIETIYFARKAM